MDLVIPRRFAGRPAIGHGGYVAGLFTDLIPGAVQVTLRRPAPLDIDLEIVEVGDGRFELRHGDDLIAEAEPATLAIDPPLPPSIDEVRAAEPLSPARYNGTGVHPTCFGCALGREPGDALRVAAAPVGDQVAAVWHPGPAWAEADGTVRPHWVLAALDCPGAFAFIVTEQPAGLLGRIVFEQFAPVDADTEHLVTGWRIGVDGRKLLAGTALFSPAGERLAAARATWFPWTPQG